MNDATPRPVVAQRLVIVLSTSGQFDSRTYRIASACAARGHIVTVIARAAPGLAAEERHPAGYRIVRVVADPWSAVPGGRILRRLWPGAAPRPSAGSAVPTRSGGGSRGRIRPRLVAAFRGAVRLAAIRLEIRAQALHARRADPGADLYHGMAYMGIPIAARLARAHDVPFVYDARDIYVDAGNLARLPLPVRRYVGREERRFARAAARVVTVNLPYAEVMAERWRVDLPLIVLNCSYRYTPARPRVRRFHELLGLPETMPIVLYQGGLSPERGIEELIAAMRSIPEATLVLMGYGSIRDALMRLAGDQALGGRVRFAPPVPPDDLLDWISAADIVAMPIQPTTLNHRLTTPNKLFEAMAAGVPVVASDLPGMAPIVRETGAGVLVDPTDPAAIADAIRGLLADPAARRAAAERALAAAHDRYNWERQVAGLLDEYGRITGRPW